MKAIVNTPSGAHITSVDDPQPGPNEALVAVRAFSVNRGELTLLEARTADWRPGQDIAGEVVREAADGSGPAVGARVAALVEQAGWAELVTVPTNRLAELPDTISYEDAAALPLVGLTALRTLRIGGSLLGQSVLITGAGGALSDTQVQLARVGGAEVTAVAAPRHRDHLLSRGAAFVVSEPSAAFGGYGLVADWVGGPSLSDALGQVAPGGTVILGSGNHDKTGLNIYDFFGHEGARIVSYLSYAYPEPPAADLAVLVGFLADGRLSPKVGVVAEWDGLAVVLTDLRERRVNGKAVLTIG